MITIFTLHPEHFNNNGDQGNIEVLASELRSAGSDFKFVEDLADADFALIGDASRAATRHYKDALEALRVAVAQRFESGRPTLLVGSAYEFFASEFGLAPKQGKRCSEFVDGDYFGYRNTDMDLPAVTRKGQFVATSLFGPFLAKNPHVLSEMLMSLGIKPELSIERLNWISKIREISAG